MIKVYIASKLSHAEEFIALRNAWGNDGIDLHARWFDQASLEHESHDLSPYDFHIFWSVDEEDVKTSQAVIVCGRNDEKLRGALVEAGIAIAMGKLVIVIGEHPDYGTWQHHPTVVRAATLESAKLMILRRFRATEQ